MIQRFHWPAITSSSNHSNPFIHSIFETFLSSEKKIWNSLKERRSCCTSEKVWSREWEYEWESARVWVFVSEKERDRERPSFELLWIPILVRTWKRPICGRHDSIKSDDNEWNWFVRYLRSCHRRARGHCSLNNVCLSWKGWNLKPGKSEQFTCLGVFAVANAMKQFFQ